MVKSLLLLGLPLLENEKRKCDRDVKGGTASFKISTSAAKKVKRKEPLLEIEKKAHDGAVKGGKSLCISRQSHFWCIKGETEDI